MTLAIATFGSNHGICIIDPVFFAFRENLVWSLQHASTSNVGMRIRYRDDIYSFYHLNKMLFNTCVQHSVLWQPCRNARHGGIRLGGSAAELFQTRRQCHCSIKPL